MLKAQLRTREQELSSTQETLRSLEKQQSEQLDKMMKGNNAVQNKASREVATLRAELTRLRAAAKSAEKTVNVEKEQLAAELGIAEAERQKAVRQVEVLKQNADKLRKELVESTRLANENSSKKAAKIAELETRCSKLERDDAARRKVDAEIAQSTGECMNGMMEMMGG